MDVATKGAPLFIVYVKVYGGVPDAPVKIILGDGALRHTVAVPPIVAVGKGLIVTTAISVTDCLHAVLVPSLTLISS